MENLVTHPNNGIKYYNKIARLLSNHSNTNTNSNLVSTITHTITVVMPAEFPHVSSFITPKNIRDRRTEGHDPSKFIIKLKSGIDDSTTDTHKRYSCKQEQKKGVPSNTQLSVTQLDEIHRHYVIRIFLTLLLEEFSLVCHILDKWDPTIILKFPLDQDYTVIKFATTASAVKNYRTELQYLHDKCELNGLVLTKMLAIMIPFTHPPNSNNYSPHLGPITLGIESLDTILVVINSVLIDDNGNMNTRINNSQLETLSSIVNSCRTSTIRNLRLYSDEISEMLEQLHITS